MPDKSHSKNRASYNGQLANHKYHFLYKYNQHGLSDSILKGHFGRKPIVKYAKSRTVSTVKSTLPSKSNWKSSFKISHEKNGNHTTSADKKIKAKLITKFTNTEIYLTLIKIFVNKWNWLDWSQYLKENQRFLKNEFCS